MNLSLSPEQILIRQSVERFVADAYGMPQREAIAASTDGFSRDHWSTFGDLGWLRLLAREEEDGFGGGALETMIVMEAFGAGLVAEPFVPAVVMAGALLAHVAGDTSAQLSAEIGAGARLAAIAYAEPNGGYDPAYVTTRARPEGDRFVVDGHKRAVPFGAALDTMLVSVRTSDADGDRSGISLLAIDAHAAGVKRRDYVTYDERRASDVTFEGVVVPASAIVGTLDDGLPLLEAALDRGMAALCAEAVGAMSTLLHNTVEYLKTRAQFGRPIGSFQALQHRAVDMLVQLELARAITTKAAAAVDTGSPHERRRAVAAAKVHVADSARMIGEAAIQMHGAIGITDELAIGHYVKRLTVIECELGDPVFALGRYLRAPEAVLARV